MSATPEQIGNDDKRLERLYDYTKFHIGIYLSSAAGLAALIGSEKPGWLVAQLIGTQQFLYLALVCMVFAGMCGGVVATSTTESRTFVEFWNGEHGPATLPGLKRTGSQWVAREHGFFWASVLFTVASVIFPFSPLALPQVKDADSNANTCCCATPASQAASSSNP